jgi:hypothetical protein
MIHHFVSDAISDLGKYHGGLYSTSQALSHVLKEFKKDFR